MRQNIEQLEAAAASLSQHAYWWDLLTAAYPSEHAHRNAREVHEEAIAAHREVAAAAGGLGDTELQAHHQRKVQHHLNHAAQRYAKEMTAGGGLGYGAQMGYPEWLKLWRAEHDGDSGALTA